jgi:hypothetical protein
MTKSEYLNAYHRRLAKLEKKYAPRVYKALMAQVKRFTDGLRQGRTDVELINPEVANVLRQMHIEGGVSEGRLQLKNLKADAGLKRLGTNQEWIDEIISLLSVHNSRFVISITETTREYITKELSEGIAEGLSLNEIAARIDKEVEQRYRNRSFAIARTELVRGTNLGTQLASEKYEYQTTKVWISANDHRVRGLEGDKFSHKVLDGKVVDSDEDFNNGEFIGQPGDPKASPANTINCRCTIALRAKRDINGNIIPKPSRLFRTI